MRYITLSALDGRKIPLKAYLDGIKLAKTNPDKTFNHGLTCWWSCTGAEIMQQFNDGLHDRINQGISYRERKHLNQKEG